MNSKHGITDPYRGPYGNNPSRSSSIEDILPPFPLVKKPEDLIITFDVNLKTQVLIRFRKSKRFDDVHNES